MLVQDFIETERLSIRPVQLDDVEILYSVIFSDPQLMGKGIYLGRVLSYEESKTFIERMCLPHPDNRYISPSVFLLKSTQELIGYGGLSNETNWGDTYRTTEKRLDVELFYVFKQAYWGQGLGTEAAKALIEHAIQQRQANRVWASIQSTNKVSQRVVEKAGMRQVKQVTHEGSTLYLYEIARTDQSLNL